MWCLLIHPTSLCFFCFFSVVFATYILLVLLLLLLLIVRIAPAHGSSNIMVYICICSLLGSFTVPSSKGLGLVAKDVFAGEPPSGRALALFLALLAVLAGSIVTQFIFINRALERFSPNTFEAIYYVTFTSSVILASALLFKEWTALDINDSLAIICSLAIMCVGVILLRLSQQALITWRKKTDWLGWEDFMPLVPLFKLWSSETSWICPLPPPDNMIQASVWLKWQIEHLIFLLFLILKNVIFFTYSGLIPVCNIEEIL